MPADDRYHRYFNGLVQLPPGYLQRNSVPTDSGANSIALSGLVPPISRILDMFYKQWPIGPGKPLATSSASPKKPAPGAISLTAKYFSVHPCPSASL